MQELIKSVEKNYQKPQTVDVRSGDTVKVHQKIKEGNKERVQIFEGLVIRTKRSKSHTASITVRRIASGVGVEKSFLVHSPLVVKIEVIKRSKVRRNYLSYMRERSGKSARLAAIDFDYDKVNTVEDKIKTAEDKDGPKTDEPDKAETEPVDDEPVDEAKKAPKEADESAKLADQASDNPDTKGNKEEN